MVVLVSRANLINLYEQTYMIKLSDGSESVESRLNKYINNTLNILSKKFLSRRYKIMNTGHMPAKCRTVTNEILCISTVLLKNISCPSAAAQLIWDIGM